MLRTTTLHAASWGGAHRQHGVWEIYFYWILWLLSGSLKPRKTNSTFKAFGLQDTSPIASDGLITHGATRRGAVGQSISAHPPFCMVIKY